MIDNSKEYILCAALKRKEPRQCYHGGQPYHEGMNDILNIEIGYRHHDIYQRFGGEVSMKMADQGFYTSKGRFVDRVTAMKIAIDAGQVPNEKEFIEYEGKKHDGELFSEDLY